MQYIVYYMQRATSKTLVKILRRAEKTQRAKRSRNTDPTIFSTREHTEVTSADFDKIPAKSSRAKIFDVCIFFLSTTVDVEGVETSPEQETRVLGYIENHWNWECWKIDFRNDRRAIKLKRNKRAFVHTGLKRVSREKNARGTFNYNNDFSNVRTKITV